MDKADRIRLIHMLDAAKEALDFAKDATRESLESNRQMALAIVKDIEIIGEAASRISKTFHDQHPQIPWAVIVAMRNRLIHGYFDMDFDLIWDTIEKDLPQLIQELEALIPPEDTSSSND